jgi:predicted permease
VRFGEILVDGRPPSTGGEGAVVTARSISPEYFRSLDIPIVRGEGFRDEDLTSNDRAVVLSQHLAEMLFPADDAIGKLVNFDHVNFPTHPAWYRVVGIAANVKNGGLSGEQTPEYYMLRRNRAEDWVGRGVWGQTSMLAVRSSLTEEETAKWIRSQVTAVDPTLPVDIATLTERVSKLADQPRFQATLVGFFAAVGLTLAVIGLYGVIAFLVTQRTQEIGVRMALGAGRTDILRLVMRRSLRLIVAGVAAGLIAATASSRLLASMLFEIGPRDPATFTAVTLLLVAVAIAATVFPARAASKVDPAVALRSE